ncbi:MAG: PAS domain S-box protein, partial [Desulfovibrionaceae bacterium]|nr:PAS domain S-box protein [Desulfovibrionaceae bacterium]
FLAPDQIDDFEQGFAGFKSRGEIRDAQYKLTRKDGAVVDVLFSANLGQGPEGEFLFARCTMIDISSEKKAARELRDKEALLRGVFLASPIGIGVIKDRIFQEVNDLFCRMTGYSRDEILGRRSLMLYPSRAEFERVGRALYGPLEKMGLAATEAVWRTREGRDMDMLLTLALLPGENPEGLASFCAQDISRLKDSERKLRESEEQYRNMFEAAADGLIVFNERGTLVDVNPAMCAMYGYVREDLIGRSGWEFLPDRLHPLFEDLLKTTGRGRRFFAESEDRRKNGSRIFMQLKGTRFFVKGAPHTLVVVRDITEQRRAEADKNLFFDLSLDLLCIAGFDGFFKRLSPSWATALGWPEGVLLSRPYLDFVHPDDREPTVEVAQSLAQGNTVAHFENRYRHGQGSYRWLSWRARAQEDRGLIVAVARDVTDAKRTEFALRRAKDSAEAASRAKGEFLANMSHEIRTPLNGILGMLQLTQSTDLSREQKEYVNTAIASGWSLLTVINDILDFSKVEAGLMDISHKDTNLAEVLRSTVDSFRKPALEKGLELKLTVDPQVPAMVRCDPARLRQILFNLVGNAVKFTHQGGVRVEVSRLLKQDDRVMLLFTIADTGIGVPEDKLDSIFESFSQVDGSYSREYQGTGLGLAIVKRLVPLMGGTIAFDSAPGKGTQVSFTIRAGLAEAPQPTASARPPKPPRRLRILVVEDNRVNRIAVQRIFEKEGHEVTCATTGQEALAALDGSDFDCALMDVQMPDMDGLEATRRIRENASRAAEPRLPIIAMTAHAMKGDRERFIEAGMDEYIAKPADRIEMLKVVYSTVERLRKDRARTGP